MNASEQAKPNPVFGTVLLTANRNPFYTTRPLTGKLIGRGKVLTGTLTGTPTASSEQERS